MIDKNLEINAGDTFEPKPKNSLYRGLTLEIVKIDNSDKPISERRFHVLVSNGETDRFWRDSLLVDFEKV
jgi:hypothetical protein